MVKVATPPEISDPTDWLMKGGAGTGPLFSALVPYGVHLALSECDLHAGSATCDMNERADS